MNCPKCGRPMISGGSFCGYCGERIVLPQQGAQHRSTQVHRPKRTPLFKAGIIVLCIIICADVLLIRKIKTINIEEGNTTVSQKITDSVDTAASADISAFEIIGSAVKNIIFGSGKDGSFANIDSSESILFDIMSPENKAPSDPYGGTLRYFSPVSEGKIMGDNNVSIPLIPIYGNDSIFRFQILSITFHDTTEIVPSDAWDIASEGAVFAWVTRANPSDVPDENLLYAVQNYSRTRELYDLHIASNGIIFAPDYCDSLFSDYRFVKSIEFNGVFNTSTVYNMHNLFSGCSALTYLDVSSFDTSTVTEMGGMFSRCSSLERLDLSGFDTSNVVNMTAMFLEDESLTDLDISGFNTGNVKDMSSMFEMCKSLEELDVSSFNTANVTDMGGMFSGCAKVKGLNVSGFDTSNVTVMYTMFQGCENLTELDLSAFNTSNVTNMTNMFAGCQGLKKLDLSGFDTSNVEHFSRMFGWCSSLEALNLTGWDTATMKDGQNALSDCPPETQERWGYLFS